MINLTVARTPVRVKFFTELIQLVSDSYSEQFGFLDMSVIDGFIRMGLEKSLRLALRRSRFLK